MPNFEFENLYPGEIVFGIDEAGLGPLAGPLVAASCYIQNQSLSDELLENINDSKKLSQKKREYLFEIITHFPTIKYGVAIVENTEIDKLGLSNAWKKAIIGSLGSQFADVCLIDGNRKVSVPNCKTASIVKGDQKSYSIAAASIIAKVTRDRIMKQIHEEFPQYGFDKHVGYGTKQHMEALSKFGPCRYHRFCYAPVKLATSKNVILQKCFT